MPSVSTADGIWLLKYSSDSKDMNAGTRAIQKFSLSRQHFAQRILINSSLLILLLLYFAFTAIFSTLILNPIYYLFPVLAQENTNNYFGAIIFLSIFSALLFSIPIIYRKFCVKQIDGVYDYRFEVTATSVTMTIEGQRIELLWKDVVEFGDTKAHFIIPHRLGLHIAIRKNCFADDAALSQFSNFCKDAWDTAKSTSRETGPAF